jgi:integrase/recombinase XerD
MSERTYHSYIWLLELFLKYLARRRITDIKAIQDEDIDRYLKERYYTINQKWGRQNSVRTRNSEIMVLKLFFRSLFEFEYLQRDLTKTVEYGKEPSLCLPKDILTVGELKKIFRQPDLTTPLGYRNRTLLELLYATGLRRAEVCHLQVTDIQWAQKMIFVKKGKFQKDRVVPVCETALEFLKQYVEDIRAELVKGLTKDHGAVFVSHTGRPIQAHNLNSVLAKELSKANLKKHVSLHSFRHTYCTHLIQAGMPLRHVQELMGHEDMNSTLVYLNLSIKDLQFEYRRAHPLEVEGKIQGVDESCVSIH